MLNLRESTGRLQRSKAIVRHRPTSAGFLSTRIETSPVHCFGFSKRDSKADEAEDLILYVNQVPCANPV